jgi:hypothetical protein
VYRVSSPVKGSPIASNMAQIFPVFPVRFSPITSRQMELERRGLRLLVGRFRPRPSDVFPTGVAAGFSEQSSKNRFSPVFDRLSFRRRPETPRFTRMPFGVLAGLDPFLRRPEARRGARSHRGSFRGNCTFFDFRELPLVPLSTGGSKREFSDSPRRPASNGENRVEIGPYLAKLPLEIDPFVGKSCMYVFYKLSRIVMSVGSLSAGLRPALCSLA